jgi:hypothetical protein
MWKHAAAKLGTPWHLAEVCKCHSAIETISGHSVSQFMYGVYAMGISKNFKDKVELTCMEGIFRLQLTDGVSLALLTEFAQDMFPGVRTEDIGVWPADDGELVVSVHGGRSTAAN